VCKHRIDVTALRADPRHEERQARGNGTDRLDLLGRRGTDHEPDRLAGAPARNTASDAGVEWLLGRLAGRVRGHAQSLELAGARVRGPAQDVGEAIEPLQQRGDGLRPEVRADRDGVGAETVEQRHGLACGRGADVPALGVHHHGHVVGDRGP
jgi:hypothetical protein